MSWIEVRLTAEAAESTRLEIEHIAHVSDERWAEFGPAAVGIGWDMAVLGLSLHLSGGPAMDPQEGMAWAGSDEGKRFMTLSGERWCEAHIASGGNEAEARAMAERTIAAYTATPG